MFLLQANRSKIVAILGELNCEVKLQVSLWVLSVDVVGVLIRVGISSVTATAFNAFLFTTTSRCH